MRQQSPDCMQTAREQNGGGSSDIHKNTSPNILYCEINVVIIKNLNT
jgi:hypothetical protein